jgi:adenylate cyclase class 2
MHAEIEAKLKVDSLPDVERRLTESDAVLVGAAMQADVYFDTATRALTQADECLRLRSERIGERERLILAYKGAKEPDDYKKRAEVEVEVNDAEAVEALLNGLGYQKALAFDKRRRLWRWQGCEVALDELPLLGAFVEIEGPDSQTIAGVQARLGLSAVPHVVDSYATLIDRELSRLGWDRREVYLTERK